MADGTQQGFNFPRKLPTSQLRHGEIVVDLFAGGRKLSISASVRMVGNSVSQPPLCALARANLDPVSLTERIAS